MNIKAGKKEAEDPKHKNFGKIPKYIQKFQQEKEQKEMEAKLEAERRNLPAGMRLMGDDERLEMVKALENTKRETMNEIERLPITMKTMAMQKRREELEEKYRNLEKQIDHFSRKKVYVAL
jgi:Calmodulin-binding